MRARFKVVIALLALIALFALAALVAVLRPTAAERPTPLAVFAAVLRPTAAFVTYWHAYTPGVSGGGAFYGWSIIFGLDPIGTERFYASKTQCANLDFYLLDTSVYGLGRGLPSLGRGLGKGDCGRRPDDRPWATLHLHDDPVMLIGGIGELPRLIWRWRPKGQRE